APCNASAAALVLTSTTASAHRCDRRDRRGFHHGRLRLTAPPVWPRVWLGVSLGGAPSSIEPPLQNELGGHGIDLLLSARPRHVGLDQRALGSSGREALVPGMHGDSGPSRARLGQL